MQMTRSEQKNKCPSFSNTTAEMRFNRRKKYKEMLLAQKEALLLQRRTRDLESRRRLLQVPVMIREPYVTSTKVVTSEVHISAATSPKGKSLFILPVSLKQARSTSATSPDPCTVTTINISNRGNRSSRGCQINVNESQSEYIPLKVVPNCKFCNAKRFQTYNNMFVFTSLGVKYDKDLAKRYHGIYTFKVQGKMYHFIDDLYPATGKGKNLQLYFYDNENEVSPCNGKGKKLTTIRNLLNCCLQITSLDYKQREGKGTCNETCSWRSLHERCEQGPQKDVSIAQDEIFALRQCVFKFK
ncbi:hypothetical protein MTR67_018929 [Solanum verrucosum]|uniref:Uncharacterized protein n=1 Tax=Solanum verrucosum TaxID=315347 RepID=A0AAF0QKJ8_SOLVR|nr:hypothetical protein MTR67_018929 [Solanum verrucosum]